MTTQSIVCGSCNAAVPYGRLSCPECGELLASVAGSRRAVAGAVTTRARATGKRAAADAGPTLAPIVTQWAEPEPAPLVAAAEPAIDREPVVAADPHPDPAPAPVAAAEPTVGASATEWMPEDWDAGRPEPEPEPEFAPTATLDDQGGDDDQVEDEPPWVLDELPPRRPEPSVLMSVAAPGPAGADSWARANTFTGAVAAPGAYVPPPPMPAVVAGAPAPARSWAGHADAPATPAVSAEEETTATRMEEFVRWLAVAGSALSAVGFLLPMASVVIGSSGTDYLARWGLAGPFHLVVVAALLVVLGLALAVDRVPLWVRVGLPGLGLGALLVGLVWPYLFVEVLDAGPGAFAIVVGALMLGVAGVVAIAADRHGSQDRPV